MTFVRLFAVLLILTLSALPAFAEIVGEEMRLPATERQVKVIHFKAPGDAPRPAALLLHGAGGFDRRLADYRRYGSAVAEAGVDAYLVYYYSPRDEQSVDFEGRYPAWAKLVGDLAGHVRTQKQSTGKVGLVGFSNGGILASGAVVLDRKINAAAIYYGTDAWPLDKSIPRHYPPLLILHGDNDAIIDVRAGRELAAHAKQLGAPVDLVIYPGAPHGFGSNIDDGVGADALKRTIAFLQKELGVQ
jgi:carboxymethylenebutenolidase